MIRVHAGLVRNTSTVAADKKSKQMSTSVITGFHAVEERIRSTEEPSKLSVLYANPGPRVRKIVQAAQEKGIVCKKVSAADLDAAVAELSETLQDHRGLVLQVESAASGPEPADFDAFVAEHAGALPDGKRTSVVVVLDSVTDPHNVGAIIRSCDQFGADLVVVPERRGARGDSEVIGRSSAGASAWVPVATVTNLVRAVEQLKEAGYWVYGADMGGTSAPESKLTGKIVLVMGSEGTGISRLLEECCDGIISIPTCGKLDSLNVSVAAGVLLYEIRRQNL